MDKMLEIIGQHEVFSTLDSKELASLSNIVGLQNYQEGEIVFDVNKRPNFLFYIKKGSLTLRLANNEYKTLGPGQIFGEIGIINNTFRSGSIIAAEPTETISICGSRLFEEEFVHPRVALKIVRALGRRITDYLRSKEQVSTQEMIERGESDYIEFKSTLRWNLFTQKKDKAIENASLKTLTAFMNSKGGTLIIGVADDGVVLGLENDQFANHDKLLLTLTSLIKERIGALYIKFLSFSVEKISEKYILRIDCAPASLPAYLQGDTLEHFYIRTGPSTTDLRLSKVYTYIKERFPSQDSV